LGVYTKTVAIPFVRGKLHKKSSFSLPIFRGILLFLKVIEDFNDKG